jgi:hypothetical protein
VAGAGDILVVQESVGAKASTTEVVVDTKNVGARVAAHFVTHEPLTPSHPCTLPRVYSRASPPELSTHTPNPNPCAPLLNTLEKHT